MLQTPVPILTALSIHTRTIKSNNTSDPFYNIIISSLACSGQLNSACKLLEEMPARNIITRALMINANMKCGLVQEALGYFERNPFQLVVLYTAVINGLV